MTLEESEADGHVRHDEHGEPQADELPMRD